MTASSYSPHRALCLRCLRPAAVCYCDKVEPLSTQSKIVILQHMRERKVAVNTARIAQLCLPNADLRVGVDFSSDPVVQQALACQHAALLFPGDSSIDVHQHPPTAPITLFVIDGTWSQAGKLFRVNRFLHELPRYGLRPDHPSNYRIRREPAAHCLATIEALAEVLAVIEPDGERFRALLRPYLSMVEQQLEFARARGDAPSRHAAGRKKARGIPVPAPLRGCLDRVVLVMGEANQWPVRWVPRYPAQTVHWGAVRLGTGACFEAVIRPTFPLAPSCPRHIRVHADAIHNGLRFDEFVSEWSRFARSDDVYMTWGRYGSDVMDNDGLRLRPLVDLRPATLRLLGRGTGPIEQCSQAMSLSQVEPVSVAGRNGRRLSHLRAIALALARSASDSQGDEAI